MSERRYSDVEVAAIFEHATRAPTSDAHQLTSAAGMTLEQLQEIGREVGIEASVIAAAARTVGTSVAMPSRTLLGMPFTVGRTVQLDRRISDDEWDRLVVDLRETFEARGVVRREGSLKQWTNGNLQVLVEPTAQGDRVRMRTAKSDARAAMTVGTVLVVSSAISVGLAALRGGAVDAGAMSALTTMGVIGAAFVALTTFRLPGWARLRRQQMESLATRISNGQQIPVESQQVAQRERDSISAARSPMDPTAAIVRNI